MFLFSVVVVGWYQNFDIFNNFKARRKVHSTVSNCALVRTGALHICIPEELKDNNYMNLPAFSNVASSDSTRSLSKSSSSRSETPANIIKSMIALSVGAKIRSKLRIHTGKLNCVYYSLFFSSPLPLPTIS